MDLDPRKIIVSVLERGEGPTRIYRITLAYKGPPHLHAEAEDADYHVARAQAMDVLVELIEKGETY
jgi:hypothetical protein